MKGALLCVQLNMYSDLRTKYTKYCSICKVYELNTHEYTWAEYLKAYWMWTCLVEQPTWPSVTQPASIHQVIPRINHVWDVMYRLPAAKHNKVKRGTWRLRMVCFGSHVPETYAQTLDVLCLHTTHRYMLLSCFSLLSDSTLFTGMSHTKKHLRVSFSPSAGLSQPLLGRVKQVNG